MIRMIFSEWIGLDRIAEEELKKIRRPAEIAITKAMLLFESAVKLKLNADEPRTGRIYGSHQASAPGEPPAPLSGDLRKSITHDGPTWNGEEVSGEVGTALPYARILEFGGITGRSHRTRILPRPYMATTYLEQRDAILAILDGAVKS